jgi:large subunit ribosomal protein L29
MPIMRIKEIAEMSNADREQKLIDLRAELARIRTMIKAGGAVDNPTRVHQLRKTIAQILTIQNENKLGIRQAPVEPAKKEEKKKKPKAEKKKEAEEQPEEQPKQ